MTVIRKRTGDKGGCCNPYSELQLEIERVDQTAIDAKTTANNTEAHLGSIEGKVNEAIAIVPQVRTNTEAIAAHGAELTDHDARIHTNTIVNDQQNTDIAALKIKTNDNAAAIEALENEVGPETVTGTIQYRLKDIDTKLSTAIKEVEMIADASTVTHRSTHISGTTESDALPVVSREQAGIMSASVYAAMEDVIANNTSRIGLLEQSAPTYDISGLVGPNPTNAEISAAFTQKYPNVPIQAGLRAADYDNAHFWQYGKNTWILLTQIDVQIATNQSLGVVKGSDTNGKIFVETDGSMSLKGYDALVSKDATHDSKISTLETGLSNANTRIDAANTNIAKNAQDIATANGNISTNTNDINGLKNRVATAEGQIVTHETKINQHTQSINGLSTDVNGLKTSKQDKLIAGSGITIASDGKTISSTGPSYRHLTGNTAVYNELLNFLHSAIDGNSLYIYKKNLVDNEYYYQESVGVWFLKISPAYWGEIKVAFAGPITYINEMTDHHGYKLRFFKFLGKMYYKNNNTNITKAGIVDLTYRESDDGSPSLRGTVYPLNDSSDFSSTNIPELTGTMSYEGGNMVTFEALANYGSSQ